MIWILIGILVVLWLVGLFAHVAGFFIHILLVAAIVLFVFNLITGRKSTAT